jgi:hypothetical protein
MSEGGLIPRWRRHHRLTTATHPRKPITYPTSRQDYVGLHPLAMPHKASEVKKTIASAGADRVLSLSHGANALLLLRWRKERKVWPNRANEEK